MTLREDLRVPRWRGAGLGFLPRRGADPRTSLHRICRPGCKATALAPPPVSNSDANKARVHV
eukprot:9820540-Alexandrium_andersonii.AAC.1